MCWVNSNMIFDYRDIFSELGDDYANKVKEMKLILCMQSVPLVFQPLGWEC